MSHSTLPEQLPPTPRKTEGASSDFAIPSIKQRNVAAYDLDYQPTPVMAPVALFLGISSFAALMGLFGMFLALAGIFVGVGVLVQIKRSEGLLSGTWLAISGMVLSSLFLGLGAYFMHTDYVNELPPGYERVNFPTQIAEKQFVIEDNQRKIHPDVLPFVDQKIYLKGYVWDTRVSQDMTEFVLLKDNGDCCFGGDPAPHDMIVIRMMDDKTFDYSTGLIGVAGTLRATPNPPLGQAVYVMEANHVARAKTVF